MYKNPITRSGLNPTDEKLRYQISTGAVEKFIYEKIKLLEKGLRDNGVNEETIERDAVNVKAMRIGKRFMPMLLVLPPNVFERGNYDPNTPSMFQNDDDDSNGARLKYYYWKLIEPWLYSKKDAEEFRERQIQRELGIGNQEDLRQFTSLRMPRRHTDKDYNGRTQVISMVVVLDPFRIFHDMLTMTDNPNQRFKCNIEGFSVMDDDAATYEVSREITKKKKERYSKNIQQILRRMNARNGGGGRR